MTNQVILMIKGIQHEFGEDADTQIITTGDYFYKNDKHYIIYKESIPDSSEEINNTLKISPHRIDLIKRGAQGVHMIFEVNRKNASFYKTPYGVMDVSFNTFDMDIQASEHLITARINYALEINDSFISDCTIMIEVRERMPEYPIDE